MNNILYENIMRLEYQLANLNPHCELVATVKANSLGELSEASRLMNKRLGIIASKPELKPCTDQKNGPKEEWIFQYQHPTRTKIILRGSFPLEL